MREIKPFQFMTPFAPPESSPAPDFVRSEAVTDHFTCFYATPSLG